MARRRHTSHLNCGQAKRSFNTAVANFKRKRNKAITTRKAWMRCKR